MEISIHDYGAVLTEVPMIPRAQPVRVSDGMGLYMVGRLMDEAEILHPARDGRGTAARLVKNLRASSVFGDASRDRGSEAD